MDVAEAKRLKQLEMENRRLKKLLAERDLEIEVMKEAMVFIELWRKHANQEMPDSSRHDLTPAEFQAMSRQPTQPLRPLSGSK